MVVTLSHRGPDRQSGWLHGNVGLGHSRLSIVDLSADANQPMHSPERESVLAYNGEIYNYRELRSMLEARGRIFRSSGDTEVVLAALDEYGPEALPMFNGMFALAYLDTRRQRLILGRDRYGIKPLYVSASPTHFAFGSEQRAIRALKSAQDEIDYQGVLEYLTFQNFLSDRTLIKSIKILPPGSWLEVNIVSMKVSEPHKYWKWNFLESDVAASSEDDYIDALDSSLTAAIRRQLQCDVEVGTYLSGGIDSGLVTSIASRQSDGIKSFTCGFDLKGVADAELNFDERESARQVSRWLGTEHQEMTITHKDMECSIPLVVQQLEEPRVGQSYPNYFAAKLASQNVRVVLSGAGGDEVFGGYPWRYERISESHSIEDFQDRLFSLWNRLLSQEELSRLLLPIWRVDSRQMVRSTFDGVLADIDLRAPSKREFVNLALTFDARTFLHGLLVVEDKLSMAHSLETRLPFLDNDVVDLALRTPVELKWLGLADERNSKVRSQEGKWILREVAKRYLPTDRSDAVKQGFSAPDATWFRSSSRKFVTMTLLADDSRLQDILEKDYLKMLLDQHFGGKRNLRLLVWSLLHLEFWLRTQHS